MTSGVYLLVRAGGRGIRMGGEIPKQFRIWRGKPLLMATILAFFEEGMPELSGISLAVPPDHQDEVNTWNFGVPTFVTAGGSTRQESVAKALDLLSCKPDLPVLIHDGVRPFPPCEPIHEAIKALAKWDGSLLGESSTDTLKRVDQDGKVLSTEPRHLIFRAQTPQVALLSTWKRAFAWAKEHDFEFTDDVSILEKMGLRVKLVESPASNFKLTNPKDWEMLE